MWLVRLERLQKSVKNVGIRDQKKNSGQPDHRTAISLADPV